MDSSAHCAYALVRLSTSLQDRISNAPPKCTLKSRSGATEASHVNVRLRCDVWGIDLT
jgi:hypothetical protein